MQGAHSHSGRTTWPRLSTRNLLILTRAFQPLTYYTVPLWCHDTHTMMSWYSHVMSWCSHRDIMIFTPWCHDIHTVMSWYSHRDVMIFTPWCHDIHTVMSWYSHCDVMIFPLWCHDNVTLTPWSNLSIEVTDHKWIHSVSEFQIRKKKRF